MVLLRAIIPAAPLAPLTMTSPLVALSSPHIILMVVVLPAPLGPTNPKRSPFGT